MRRLAAKRPLFGISGAALRHVRDPIGLTQHLRQLGVSCPGVVASGSAVPRELSWLLKPRRGAGGFGIRPARAGEIVPRGFYAQERIAGSPASALYVADGSSALFLGATRQLIGEPWLHAAPFRYCGNIGPLDLSASQARHLTDLGGAITQRRRLRGLFGVDGILKEDNTFWPIEVNPRYTASVEVLERATGLAFLDRHARVFRGDPRALEPLTLSPCRTIVGKAVLFAARDLVFPETGPWQQSVGFADIPASGEHLLAGHPVLTFFVEGTVVRECESRLRSIGGALSRYFAPPKGKPST